MTARTARADLEPHASHSEGLKSLRKATRVLECFSLDKPRLSLAEIARKVDLPLSSTHRILATLRAAGLVEQAGDRELYRLGLKLLELGSTVLGNMEGHCEALPFIGEFVRETGETVHLGLFDGTQVVSIEKMESTRGLASHVSIGRGAPAYCTGVGKALLAFQPDEVIGQVCRLGLSRFTPQTITDPRILCKELAQVRRRGYAIDNTEHQADVRCIAAMLTVVPALYVQLWEAVQACDHKQALALHERLLVLWNAMGAGENVHNLPANTKTCQELLGRKAGLPRAPMPTSSPTQVAQIRKALEAAELL